MEQITTEEKLRIESETASLKREYKHASESLARLKSDTSDVMVVRDKVTKELNERNEELLSILNDISSAKLAWVQEKNKQLDELAVKQSEADNVIKRKSELNAQEEKLRQIETETINARNEARQLEFQNAQKTTEFENKEKDLTGKVQNILLMEKKLEKDKEDFKHKVIAVIETIKHL